MSTALLTIAAALVLIAMSVRIGYELGESTGYKEAYKDGARDIIEMIPDDEWQKIALQFVDDMLESEDE